MEILEEKRLPAWHLDVVCQGQGTARSKPGCGSRLRVVPADLIRVQDYVKHKGEQVAVFTCPLKHCGVETDLQANELPPWIFDSLRLGDRRGSPPYSGCGRD